MTDPGPSSEEPATRFGADAAASARALLVDAFGRIREQYSDLARTLAAPDAPEGAASWRPDPDANSIEWLLWHLARVQDDHLAGLSGAGQVWAEGWSERFALPLPQSDIGYGHTSEQVGQVHAAPQLLDRYHGEVHAATLRYLGTLTDGELERVVDRAWDPPVTAAVRLISVVGDCTAHLGQAQYVLGMARRR